jgi:cytoskeleton protein RodZ
MSEGGQTQAPGVAGEGAPEGPSAGTILRQAREAAGLHVAALAVSLKVPVRKLEALESDHYDLLTDAVFARALASSVCRTLKIDPQPVLDRLPQMPTPRLTRQSEGINTPFRAPSDGAPPTWLDQLSRPVFLAVFALLLAALVLVLLPKAQQADSLATAANPALPNPADAQATPVPPVPALPSAPAAADATTAALSPAAAGSASIPTAAPLTAGPAVPEVAPVPAAAATPATPASGIVVFRTSGPSWVEVTDAKGVVAVRKVLEAGEATAASGALPLRVIIGRVDATEVQVRGKPFDLRPVSRDNVARFEVN